MKVVVGEGAEAGGGRVAAGVAAAVMAAADVEGATAEGVVVAGCIAEARQQARRAREVQWGKPEWVATCMHPCGPGRLGRRR